jgi:hypothetical protein
LLSLGFCRIDLNVCEESGNLALAQRVSDLNNGLFAVWIKVDNAFA